MIRMFAGIWARIRGKAPNERPSLDVVASPEQGCIGELVFVHGLGGNSHGTWLSKTTKFFWPKDLARQFPRLAVYSVNYNADPTEWTSPSMSVPEMGATVADALLSRHQNSRPIVFITHSLGGLVVKQLLRQSADSITGAPVARLIADTVGVVFIATPHAGAGLADVVNAVFRLLGVSQQVRDLSAANALLTDLNRWYRDNAKSRGISTAIFYEKDSVGPTRVVNAMSADIGIEGVTPVPLTGDHFAVCKPTGGDAPVYLSVQRFLDDRFGSQGLTVSSLRSEETTHVQALLTNREPKPRYIRTVGQPGSGKTCFSTAFAAKAIGRGNIVHITEDQAGDPLKLIDALRRAIPVQLFATAADSTRTQEARDDGALVAAAAQAIASSRLPVAIEGTAKNPEIAIRLLDQLLALIPSTNDPQILITSYERLANPQPDELEYQLPPFSFRDAAILMRSYRPGLSIPDMTAVYERYSGHAQSISAWAASGDDIAAGLPWQTDEAFQKHWQQLTPGAQNLFLALAAEPDLATPQLMPPEDVSQLTKHGLLSQYPTARMDGVTHYVHHLARESCTGHATDEAIRAARIEYLRSALRAQVPNTGPRLAEVLIAHGQKGEAADLIIANGRDWLESAGLRLSHGLLRSATLAFAPDSPAFFFCQYLSALASLFAGEYESARRDFRALATTAFASRDDVRMAVALEEVECARRRGLACDQIEAFNTQYHQLEAFVPQEGVERHFAGVARFLAGHFLRHFGQTDAAHTQYEKALEAFVGDDNRSNIIEAVHCLYGKQQCAQAAAGIEAVRGYENLVSGTGSQFLLGLFAVAEARALAAEQKFDEALDKIGMARIAFTQFGSTHHYQRCCALIALISIVRSDFPSAQSALDEMHTHRISSRKLRILDRFMLAHSAGRTEREEWLTEAFSQSLASGNLASAVAVSLLHQRQKWPAPRSGDTFRIPSIRSDGDRSWVLEYTEVNGIAAAIQKTRELYAVDDDTAGIFLFD